MPITSGFAKTFIPAKERASERQTRRFIAAGKQTGGIKVTGKSATEMFRARDAAAAARSAGKEAIRETRESRLEFKEQERWRRLVQDIDAGITEQKDLVAENLELLEDRRQYLGMDREYDEIFRGLEEEAQGGADISSNLTNLDIAAGHIKTARERLKSEAKDRGKYVEYVDEVDGVTKSISTAGYKARFLEPVQDKLEILEDDEEADYKERSDAAKGKLTVEDDKYFIHTKYGSPAAFEQKRRKLEAERDRHLNNLYPSESKDIVVKFDRPTDLFIKRIEDGEVNQTWIDNIKANDVQTFNFLIQQGYDPFDIQKRLFQLGK